MEIELQSFLTSALDGVNIQLDDPAVLPPMKDPRVRVEESQSGPDGEERNLCPLWEAHPGLPSPDIAAHRKRQ